MVWLGLGVRSTAATGVHDASSRSHALLRIHVQRPDLTAEGGELLEGSLTLVDLAGSEHRIDSMYCQPSPLRRHLGHCGQVPRQGAAEGDGQDQRVAHGPQGLHPPARAGPAAQPPVPQEQTYPGPQGELT